MDAAQSLHPTDQTLSSYGLGKLDDRSAEAVNEHLEHCSNCRERVAEIPADSFLGRVRDAQAAGEPASGPSPTGGTPGDPRSNAPAFYPADMLPPGLAEHPDYEIERELGRGGMGVVYLAHNKLMGRDEVLKVMGKQIMDRPGVLDRFLREIRAVASLRHPNIVTAYSAVRLGESIVFAMEYVEGLDLSKMVKAKGPLPVGHACNFVTQAALGLQHAHEEGLVHRDIKPGNLMLSRKRDRAAVKVLDFGLAKATREEKIDGGLTHEGQALGTPDFIAPEQILDAQSADVRADIYSLGGTFYYLLTGRPPFKANSLYDIYQAHISRDADPLNLIRPEVPAELAALVAKMMAKDPARRFQTPGEIAEALTPFFKRGSVAFKNPQVDVSQAVRATAGPTVTGAVSTRTQAATDVGGATDPLQKAEKPTVPEGRWESLIDFRETERSIETKPGVAPLRWSPRVWPSVAVGVLMFGFVAAWLAGAFRVRTPEGDLVFDGLPNESVVTIDGKAANVEWPGGQSPAKVSVSAGEHRVLVEHGGVTVHGEDVMIEAGDKRRIKVRWEPRLAAQPPKNHAVATATSTNATPESPAQAQSGKQPMPPGASRSTIPADAKELYGKYYKVFKEQLSWHHARTRCQEMGGHLAIVRNEEENRFLTSLVLNAGLNKGHYTDAFAWLGATDELVEGRWVWVDGTEMRYNAWEVARNQPNNARGGTEHYLIIIASFKGVWWDLWNEGGEGWSPGFVCQWDKDVTRESEVRATADRNGGQATSAIEARNPPVSEPSVSPTLSPVGNQPAKVLIITGDNVAVHDWKGTTEKFKEILNDSARYKVEVTEKPAKDLTDENLAKYDLLLLNYKETSKGGHDTKWSNTNRLAFLKAVKDGGKGLYVHHFASSAFEQSKWEEFEKLASGGWWINSFHGPSHLFTVKKTNINHPISKGLPLSFEHLRDELYSNSLLTDGSIVIATAYSDPAKPKGTGKDEAVIWVNQFGKGRVINNVLGHDTDAMSDPNYQLWVRQCVDWASGGTMRTASGRGRAISKDGLEVADRKAKVLGKWSIEGEELVQLGKDNPSACIIGDVNWSNYNLDFEVMATSGPNGFETWLHYNDLGIVVMAWGGNGNTDHALAGIYGGKRVEYNEVKQKGAIRYGRWYTVRFQVRGSQISCFADGRLAYRDQKVGVSNGRIALATFASTARFRNVRITTPDGVILWEGLPELPAH